MRWVGKAGMGVLLVTALLPSGRAEEVIPAHGAYSREPAGRWEEAFVTGNGRLGALLFGNPTNETFVANHCRLFAPLGNREIVPDLARYVPELRRVIREQGYDAAMRFFLGKAREQGYPGIIPTDPFHPAFFVNIRQEATGTVSDLARTENFRTGEVEIRWRDARGEFRRRLIASRTDNLIALSLTGPGPGAVTCDLAFPRVAHALVEPHQDISAGWVGYHNIYTQGKGGFDAGVRIVTRGGHSRADGDTVRVTGADEVLLLMRVVPWKTPLPADKSEAWAYSAANPDFAAAHLGIYKPAPPLPDSSVVPYLSTADAARLLPQVRKSLETVRADYAALLAPHAKAHAALFDRVTLDLGGGADRARTTEDLLGLAQSSNRLPPALAEKMYDAGRYMFICSAGELLPNLQGIWTGSWSPAWSGDFTLDTNVQAAMASACSANLADLMEGYFRTIEGFYPEWRLNAQRIYGCRGYFSNARASNTCLLLHWGDWQGVFWTAGAGWLSSFFTDYAEYTGDRAFLKNRCVPLLKELAAFYEDFLAGTEKDGRVEFIPSYNPETACGISATMDIAVTRQVLMNLVRACRELKIESANVPRWETLLAKLPAYPVNPQSELTEWIAGGLDAGHRHHSQLYPCFQSFDPLFETSPELRQAAVASVRAKIRGSDAGGEQSSFGRVQSGISAAYLGLREEAYSRLQAMGVKRSMYASLITSHEPNGGILNTDGNGGIPQIVDTMLVFSRPGRLDLVPALPAAWPKGEIRGVRARGQITIDRLAWDKPGARLLVELTSGIAQKVTLRLPGAGEIKAIDARNATVRTATSESSSREVTLKAGARARLNISFAD